MIIQIISIIRRPGRRYIKMNLFYLTITFDRCNFLDGWFITSPRIFVYHSEGPTDHKKKHLNS